MREIRTEYETEEVEKTKTVKEYETVEKEQEVIISDLTGEEINPDEHLELHVNPKLEIELNRVDLSGLYEDLTGIAKKRMRGRREDRNSIRKTVREMSFLVSDTTIDVAESEIQDYEPRRKNVTQPELNDTEVDQGTVFRRVFVPILILISVPVLVISDASIYEHVLFTLVILFMMFYPSLKA